MDMIWNIEGAQFRIEHITGGKYSGNIRAYNSKMQIIATTLDDMYKQITDKIGSPIFHELLYAPLE